MMNALFNGVSGLRTHQRRMDVIGNNIANSNTVGFKRGRAEFAEMLGQQMVGSGGRLRGTVGNGVQLAGITQAWTQGSFEFTGLPSDLALSGDGFFIVGGAQSPMLSRAGNFGFDATGRLVTPGGQAVQGWPVQQNGTVNTGTMRDVQLNLDLHSSPVESSATKLTGNLSADLAANSTDGTASVSSVIYDSAGRSHTVVLKFNKTSDTEWTVASAEIAGDPDATPPVAATVLTGAGGTVTFNTDGSLASPPNITLGGTYPNSTDDVNVTVDLGGITHFGGSTTVAFGKGDGQAAGEVAGYGFDTDGRLMVQFSNGQERAIFQLALGEVSNPNGLRQQGDGLYSATMASGDLTFGRAGQEIGTSVIAGALEASNVDLATEFTDMIVTQRGYQASARVITTSDELLQEVVSLKR